MAKKKNYVNNADLKSEIMDFKETGVYSEKLGKMIYLIAQRLANKPNFANYTYKEDMISNAVLTTLKYLKNFNPEKSSNAFAYVTQICWRAFLSHISYQKGHSQIKQYCYDKKEDVTESYSKKAINYQELNDYFEIKE